MSSVPPLRLPFVDEAMAREISTTLEEPGWLLDERLDAVRRVADLPAEGNQLFTPYLDLRAAHFDQIETYRSSGVVDEPAGELPSGAAGFIHVREDSVIDRALSPVAADAGVVIGTFEESLQDQPELLRRVIADGASLPGDDAFAQVARAASSLGLLIHVPPDVTLEAPIVVRWDVGAAGKGLVSRTVISLGEGSRASILEEQVDSDGRSDPERQSLWWGTSEVLLGPHATLDLAGEQDFDASTLAIVSRMARLDEGATLRWALASIGARLHKSRIDNILLGRGSRVQQVEIGFGAGEQLFDLTSYTRHVGQDTTGDLLSKGVFLDKARGYIKGLIEIQRTATGTDSFLGEFSMLLGRKARSVTIPSLEIDQPNVRRASHSSSVGPIDEAQIFYLMSRGLEREDARKAIVLGFLEPVVARIPLADAQDRLRGLLERKWPIPDAQAVDPAA